MGIETAFTEKVISRLDAAVEGLRFFYTGKPCKRGHLCRRYTSIGICVLCSRENSRGQQAAMRALKRHRAGGGPFFIVDGGTPELQDTAKATIRMLGLNVKEPTQPVLPQMPDPGWRPPPELVNPVVAQTRIFGLRSGMAADEYRHLGVDVVAIPPLPPVKP